MRKWTFLNTFFLEQSLTFTADPSDLQSPFLLPSSLFQALVSIRVWNLLRDKPASVWDTNIWQKKRKLYFIIFIQNVFLYKLFFIKTYCCCSGCQGNTCHLYGNVSSFCGSSGTWNGRGLWRGRGSSCPRCTPGHSCTDTTTHIKKNTVNTQYLGLFSFFTFNNS